MPTIKEIFKQVRAELRRSPKEKAKELKRPSGYEYGLRHNDTGNFILLRDDGVVETNAGNGTAVTVDGLGQVITATAAGIALEAQAVQVLTPPGKFYLGYQPLHPFWYTTNPLDFISPFLKAPIIQNVPTALDTCWVMTGPTPAVPNAVPMSTFFRAQPLLGLNEQLLILSRNLGETIKNLRALGT
jgi:hypothetical protein